MIKWVFPYVVLAGKYIISVQSFKNAIVGLKVKSHDKIAFDNFFQI